MSKSFDNGGGDCLWITAANWSDDLVPAAADDVTISIPTSTCSSVVLNLGTAATVNSIVIASGTDFIIHAGSSLSVTTSATVDSGGVFAFSGANLDGAGSLTVNGTIRHFGGTIGGTGSMTVNSGAVVEFWGTDNSCVLARSVTNAGTIRWLNTILPANGYTFSGATLDNTGVIDIQADRTIGPGAGSPTVNNNSGGTIKKSAGSGTATIPFTVNNAAGATIRSDSGTLALNGTVSLGGFIDGAGTVILSGTLTWVGGTMQGGGITNVTGLPTFTCSAINCGLNNRTLNLQASTLFSGSNTFGLSSGAVINIAAGTTLALSNGGDFAGSGSMSNAGTISKTSVLLSAITIPFNQSATGTIDVDNGAVYLSGGGTIAGGTLDVASSMQLVISGGTLQVTGPVSTPGPGVIWVDGGTLNFGTGGTVTLPYFAITSGTLTGSDPVRVSSRLDWGGGTITGGSSLEVMNGATSSSIYCMSMPCSLDNRSLTLNAPVAFTAPTQPVDFANGASLTIGSTGSLTVTNDGDFTGSGTISNAGTITKNTTGGTTQVSPALTNSGTGTISVASGTFELSGTGPHLLGGTLTGAGVFRFSGGTSTVSLTWTNRKIDVAGGTVNFQTAGNLAALTMSSGTLGGTANLAVTGNSTLGGGTIAGTGTMTIVSGVTVSVPAAPLVTVSRPFVNQGTLDVTAGTIDFTGTFSQTAGNVNVVPGATVQAVLLDLDGGTLTGKGTIIGNITSDATVAPGASPGTLAITGNYTQGPGGTLAIEVGGTTAGTQHDRVNVSGIVTLDGTLSVTLINSFFPTSGNNFPILTFGSRPGSTDFATKTGLVLGSGTSLNMSYGANDLVLTTFVIQTDLSATLTVAPAPPIPNGSAFTYNVTVANAGPSNATGVSFTAPLPANATFVSASPAVCTGAPNLTCTLGSIPPGGNASVAINVTASGTGTAPLTVTASGSEFDPVTGNNADSESPLITAAANLGVTVTGPASAVAGTSAVYTITVTNNGPDSANSVSVAASPSADLVFASNSGACTGAFPCAVANLTSGQSAVITSNWTISPNASGSVQLSATAAATSPGDPIPANDTAVATTTVTRVADLAVVKTGPAAIAPEAATSVTYNITVTNNGPSSADSVVLNDPTPPGLVFASATGDCASFPCPLGTIPTGGTKSTQVTFTITGASLGTTFTNTASVTSTTSDPNAGNNSSSVATTISNCPSPAITHAPTVNGSSSGNTASIPPIAGAAYAWSITNGTITAGAATPSITFTAGATGTVQLSVTVTAGSCTSSANATIPIIDADVVVTKSGPATVSPTNATTITYAISVTNNGPSPAASVTLHDPVPAGITFASATAPCAAGFPCVLGTLPSGQTVNILTTYNFSGGSAYSVTNTANATSTTPDRTPSNNSAAATTNVAACPAITISAPPNLAPAANSFASATGIAGAAYVWSIVNGTINGGADTSAITFTAGGLGTTTLNVTVTIGQCTSTATFNVTISGAQSDVTIGKSAPPSVLSGATFAYTLTVSNNGPSPAQSVIVTDALPTGVAFVSVNHPACSGGSIVNCTIPSLASGASDTITVTVTAPEGPVTLTNTADVSASGDPIPANNSSTVTTSVRAAPSCPTTGPLLVTPAENSTVTTPVTFTWRPVTGAIEYAIYVRAGDGELQILGTTEATTFTGTVPAGPIHWVVGALFAGCPPARSFESSFIARQPAACEGTATPLAPANNTSTADALVEFRWTAVATASGYRVWLQTGTAAPQVLATTLGTSLAETIPAGAHLWWIETLFDGCASRESQRVALTIIAAQNCDGRGAPALVAPADGLDTAATAVAFAWTAVAGAIEYELWLAPAGGVPTLIQITTQTTHTANVPPGRLEWFVRAVFAGCPATQSAVRSFIYTPPPDCTANQRAVLLAPAEGEDLIAPLSFDWNDVPGATAYELHIDDALAATSTTSGASGIMLNLGEHRWFVRTRFAQGCSALDSTESRFAVIAPVAACTPLAEPVIAAPGQISSGTPAYLQWSFVAGATGYVSELDASPAFTDPIVTNHGPDDRQRPFVFANDGVEPLPIYVRVHAVDATCNPPSSGPGATAIIYILPEVTNEASTLAGDLHDVEYALPVDASLAGQRFTATPTAAWISVTPASGIVPPGGMFLTAIAHTAGLDPGTNIGGVTIATADASGITAHATTVTTPISVNIVSPVTPTPKNTPPPDALVIPAVASAAGINAQFQSDVRISNTSAQVMKYQLSFIPTGDAGIAAGLQTTVSIEPGRTIALDDVLRSWFGTGGASVIGTLEVRPLTEAAKSTSSATVGALANLVTFASSRTFSITPGGTYGQFIPAIPFANFIGRGTTLSLQQIAQSTRFRTNLGLVEGSGQPVSLLVKVFGAGGAKLTEFPLSLTGGQHTQLNAFLTQHGITALDDGRVEVEVTSGDGKVTAYASVLDNATADPLLVTPVPIGQSGETKWVIPGVAALANGAANWQTDVRLFNAGSAATELALSFVSMNGSAPKTATVTLQPGEVRQLDQAVSSLFNATQDGGALHIASATPARLVATARTYNQTTQGTYGQFISAVTPRESVGVGSRPLQLLQIEESARYRSNIGFAEVTGKPVTLEVTIVPPDAKFTAPMRVDLTANEFRQFTSMLTALGIGEIYNARISVRAVAGEGRATAYASVIDAKTSDPTYVPAQ